MAALLIAGVFFCVAALWTAQNLEQVVAKYPELLATINFYVLDVVGDTHVGQLDIAPGTVLDIAESGISVSCGDGVIILKDLLDTEYNTISLELFVKKFGVCVGDTFH